jgi:hypothetical protein
MRPMRVPMAAARWLPGHRRWNRNAAERKLNTDISAIVSSSITGFPYTEVRDVTALESRL